MGLQASCYEMETNTYPHSDKNISVNPLSANHVYTCAYPF